MRMGSPKLLAAAVLVALACVPAFARSSYNDGRIAIEAGTISIDAMNSKVIASGRAHVVANDKLTKTGFSADAEKIVVILFPKTANKGGAPGIGSVKSANLSGPVRMVRSSIDPATGVKTVSTATADSATYNGTDMMAHLTGNVKIVSENPAIFEEPAVMTGDTATVNLKPNAGPDETRFEVKSSPGVSRIEFTPKSEEKKTK